MKIHPLYKKCYYPYTEWKIPEEFFLRLPDKYSFDLAEMKAFINKKIEEVGLNTLKLKGENEIYSEGYTGMGFTYRKGAPDPHHDAFRVFNEEGQFDSSSTSKRTMGSTLRAKDIHHFEKNFTEKTEHLAGPLAELSAKFESPITKIRIIELAPGFNVHEHFDFPFYENVRIHTVLETNDDVEWWVEDQRFKIPSDGNCYWFDTGRFHKILNKGTTPRRLLTIHLSVFKDLENKLRIGPEVSLVDLIKNGKL